MVVGSQSSEASANGKRLDEDSLARAQCALDKMVAFFDKSIHEDVSALAAARHLLHSGALTAELRAMILARVESLEVQGTLYGVPLLVALASSLQNLIAAAPDIKALPLPLVDAHINALKALSGKAWSEAQLEGEAVIDDLRRNVRETVSTWRTAGAQASVPSSRWSVPG